MKIGEWVKTDDLQYMQKKKTGVYVGIEFQY